MKIHQDQPDLASSSLEGQVPMSDRTLTTLLLKCKAFFTSGRFCIDTVFGDNHSQDNTKESKTHVLIYHQRN